MDLEHNPTTSVKALAGIQISKASQWNYPVELSSFCCGSGAVNSLNCTVFRLQPCQETDMHTFGSRKTAANYTSWPGDLQHNIGLEIAGEFVCIIEKTIVSGLVMLN